MATTPETLLARSTLARYLEVVPGESVTVEAWSPALGWARALVVEARRLGAEPVLALEDEEGFFRSLAGGGPVPTAPAALAALGGAYVYLAGPEAFPRLFGLRPDDLARTLERHGRSWRACARASRLRAVRLAIATVTATAAARYGVNLDGWRTEMVEASVVPPSRLGTNAATALHRLARARRMAIRHPNGTRLELSLRPGRWIEETGASGRTGHRGDPVWENVPTGRLVVPVVASSTVGTWEANRPSYDRFGETAVGVGARFAFRDGRLTEVAFDRGGEEFARTELRNRPRPNIVAAITVGLNPRVARGPEIGDLAVGALGLRLGLPGRTGRSPGGRPPYVSLLQGAEVELDGRAWLVEGRAVHPRTAPR